MKSLSLSPGCHCKCLHPPSRCLIVEDNFDRPDEAPPAGWTEDAGTGGGVVSTELELGPNARMRNGVSHTSQLMIAEALVKGPTTGDSIRIFVAMDATTWLAAEIDLDPACGTLRLISDAGQIGDAVSTGPLALDTQHKLSVCYDGARLTAVLLPDRELDRRVRLSELTTATGPGQHAGLGTGTLATVAQFDDFLVEKVAAEDPLCPRCTHEDDCDIGGDNFNDSSIDCRWNQTGSWTEGADGISGDGRLMWDVPGDEGVSQQSRVLIDGDNTPTQSIAIIRADDPPLDYFAARLIHGAIGVGTLELLHFVGGAPTVLASETLTWDSTDGFGEITLAVCQDGTRLTAGADRGTNQTVVEATTPAASADQRHLGFEGVGTGKYTGWGGTHREGECGQCPVAPVPCEGEPITGVSVQIPNWDLPSPFQTTDTLAGTYILSPVDPGLWLPGTQCNWETVLDIAPHVNYEDPADPGAGVPTKTTLRITAARPDGAPWAFCSGWMLQFEAAPEFWMSVDETFWEHPFTQVLGQEPAGLWFWAGCGQPVVGTYSVNFGTHVGTTAMRLQNSGAGPFTYEGGQDFTIEVLGA